MKTTVLRIYMLLSARMKNPTTVWQKIFGVSLAHYLVKKAKDAGIKQAIVQRSEAGYLQGENLVFDQVEAVPMNLPLCVELIDEESALRAFVDQNQEQLSGCRVVVFNSAEILRASDREKN